jgi:hypothetical protein
MAEIEQRKYKIDASKKELIDLLENYLKWELGHDGKFYHTSQPVYDNTDSEIGEITVAIYPMEKKFIVSIDKKDYPKGHKWEVKSDLSDYKIFIKDSLDDYREKKKTKD